MSAPDQYKRLSDYASLLTHLNYFAAHGQIVFIGQRQKKKPSTFTEHFVLSGEVS